DLLGHVLEFRATVQKVKQPLLVAFTWPAEGQDRLSDDVWGVELGEVCDDLILGDASLSIRSWFPQFLSDEIELPCFQGRAGQPAGLIGSRVIPTSHGHEGAVGELQKVKIGELVAVGLPTPPHVEADKPLGASQELVGEAVPVVCEQVDS